MVKRSIRDWHKRLVMREMAGKSLKRVIDTYWLLHVNLRAKSNHLPKYHGTKYRGMKRWWAKENSVTKLTKGDKNGKQ